jgi:hypothetical protein
MAKKARSQGTSSRNCRDCENWDEMRNKVRAHELIEKAIKQFEKKISGQNYEPTVAEYVKLLQLGQELGLEDEAREIKVTWVGPNATSDIEK